MGVSRWRYVPSFLLTTDALLCSDTLLRHQKDHSENASTTATELKDYSNGSEESELQQTPVPTPTPNMSLNGVDVTTPAQDKMPLETHVNTGLDMGSLDYTANASSFHDLQDDADASKSVFPNTFSTNEISNNFEVPMDAFNFDFESNYPAWLVDGDFHAGMLDTPLVTTMAELKPAWHESPYATMSTGGNCHVKSAPSMKHLWFTPGLEQQEYVPVSGTATPLATQVEVDDSYRQTLHQSLLIRAPNEPTLPSADFLNLCVRSYFSRFHPVFPVVHAPTFRPSKANSMVLLSICSVGSLFTGSVHAIRQGVQIFERLHKAVLANWDRLINRGMDEKISLIQTAIIGQTFGLLSGEPKHLAIVDAFNGTLISWARRLGSFKTKKLRDLDLNLSPKDLDLQWRTWAKNEELIRIALSVHIHDAELASIFHHEPFLRHNSRQLPVAASQQTFMASKAEEWRVSYLNDPSNFNNTELTPASIDANVDFDILAMPNNSYFTAYTVLQGICVNIVENRVGAHFTKTGPISNLLTTFYSKFLQGAGPWESDSMDMTILWHSAYMSMCADFDLLERAIGRDGGTLSNEDQLAVTAWANSKQAQRCVIHGTIIQKKLENLPLGFEPAIHVPRAMFRAGIAWFCYTRYAVRADGDRTIVPDTLDFPEFKLVNVNPAVLLFQANGYKHGRPSAMEINAALCGLTDLLRRIGHWEIARRFAAILGALLHNEAGQPP